MLKFPSQEKKVQRERKSIGERLRNVFEELGPTFIKIGQILSTRSDILPESVIKELEKLQDSVTPMSFSEVKNIIENEFATKLEEVFHEFDETPIAAASIAQVHSAILDSGRRAVVKVQRPGIERTIYFDLRILEDLAYFIDVHTKYGKLYDFRKMVQNFEEILKDELDFRIEGENAEKFKENFLKDKGVSVPEIFWSYSGRRVLTMQFIDGVTLNEFKKSNHNQVNKREVAKNLTNSMINQILRDGFFHADPHPGNIMILSQNDIVFLDLGMIGRLSEQRRNQFIKILAGIAFNNSKLIVQAMVDLGVMVPRKDMKKLEIEIDFIREKYLSGSINKLKLGEIFREIFKLAFEYKIVMPSEFAMITKALVTVESQVEQLDSEVNILELIKPIAKKMMIQTYSVDKVGKMIMETAFEYGHLLREIPAAASNILKKVENDELTVQFKLKDIDNTQKSVDKIFNRLSFSVMLLAVSIITAGIIVSSGLSSVSGSQVDLSNVAILRISLIIAGIMIIGLFFSILRTGRF